MGGLTRGLSLPHPALQIDRSNPVNNRLVFCQMPRVTIYGGGLPVGFSITGYPTTSGASQGVIKFGATTLVGLTLTATDGTKINYSGSNPAITTSDGAWGGDFTFLAVANPANTGSVQNYLFSQRNNSSGKQCNLAANYDYLANGFSGGKFSMMCFSGSLTGAISTAGMVDGNTHVFVGRRSGTTCNVYRDGIDVTASNTSSSSVVGDASAGMVIGGVAQLVQNVSANCTIVLVAAWNRALSPAEIVVLGQNPLTMFVAIPQPPFFFSAAPVLSQIGRFVFLGQA